ncbi:YciI family protein [Paludibaculum fermentans]|uniref:YciI family protein n=1 Tax=Paludibaculum fermentans TaxID=1473598 RepID=UPI003EB802A8
MKFLCMVFVDEAKLDALSAAESQALDDISLAYDATLRHQGRFLAAQALQSVSTAATVRVRDGQVVVTDGPFAEAREQVGGFILIDASDREEAIQVAARIPAIQLGGIEVRPIKELVASADLLCSL